MEDVADRQRRALSFGGIAEDYDRCRPETPDEAVAWVLPPNARTVAEIGAGTGALTRRLALRVSEIHAIEPDARMRAVLERRVPSANVLDGKGEAIPLPDGSVDAVLAASSWHWVDPDKGFAEVTRVLRPGGVFGLLWTRPDRSVPWVAEFMQQTNERPREYTEEEKERRRRRYDPEIPAGAPFGTPETKRFSTTTRVAFDDLIGLPLTYSAVIVQDLPDRQALLDRIAEFARSDLGITTAEVDLPITCMAWRVVRR